MAVGLIHEAIHIHRNMKTEPIKNKAKNAPTGLNMGTSDLAAKLTERDAGSV